MCSHASAVGGEAGVGALRRGRPQGGKSRRSPHPPHENPKIISMWEDYFHLVGRMGLNFLLTEDLFWPCPAYAYFGGGGGGAHLLWDAYDELPLPNIRSCSQWSQMHVALLLQCIQCKFCCVAALVNVLLLTRNFQIDYWMSLSIIIRCFF